MDSILNGLLLSFGWDLSNYLKKRENYNFLEVIIKIIQYTQMLILNTRISKMGIWSHFTLKNQSDGNLEK